MKKGGTMNFWDYLAWILLFGVVVWVLLKILGVFNTPLWLEYAPVFPGIYIAGWAMERLRTATEDIKTIKTDIKEIDKDMNVIRHTCPRLLKKTKSC